MTAPDARASGAPAGAATAPAGGAPDLRPVFIHSNRRTGGTALAAALRAQTGIRLFFDPFNAAFAMRWPELSRVGPGGWESRHPAGMGPYFAEYAPLVEAGRVRGASPRFHDRYLMRPDDRDRPQEAFLRSLIDLAQATGDRPVLKTEQTEGRLPWLRARFPDAVHIGLLRCPDGQFASWIEQLALGNTAFCEAAHRTVSENRSLFRLDRPLGPFDAGDWDALECVFDRLHAVTQAIRRDDTDLALDISPESREDPAAQERALRALLGEGAAPFTRALRATRADAPAASAHPPGRDVLRRMHAIVMPLRRQVERLEDDLRRSAERGRDHETLNAAHVALLAAHADMAEQARRIQTELDAARSREEAAAARAARLAEDLDRMSTSASWRLTAPVRRARAAWRSIGN